MSKQQLRLSGSKKARTNVDELAVQKLAEGDIDLKEALGLSEATIEDMRRQAIALYGSAKYEACIEVVLGISALGSVHPVDPLLLARCYTALGDVANAELCAAHYERLSEAFGLEAGGAS